MEQNDKQQQQRNHYTSYSLIGFSSIIILVITVFIFSSLFSSSSSSSSQCLVERVGKMFNVEMDFRQRRANGRHESALSLSSLSKSRDSLNCLSLSLSFVQHVWASFSSTEHTPCIYRGQSEMREKERNAFKANWRPVNFLSLASQKASKVTLFSLRCFSLSLSTIFRLVRGRQIIRGGRANTKGVCGRVWF